MIGPQVPKHLKRRRSPISNPNSNGLEPIAKRAKLCDDVSSTEEQSASMHPRNIYGHQKPDYRALSEQYEFFKDVVNHNPKTGDYYINYKDPRANLMLTKVLLKHDFDLNFEHPINHLCPPITQRLNYILWIQDLLQCIEYGTGAEPKFHGLDIGVGASCIFPLLGIRTGEKEKELWTFEASDIDQESLNFAKRNVELNELGDRITIMLQSNPKHIFKGILDAEQEEKDVIHANGDSGKMQSDNSIRYNFTVCNPPFFEHLDETGHNKSRSNPATKSELVYDEGGELGFIELMIKEINELALHQKVHWFTTMLGKKASIKPITKLLNQKEMRGGFEVFIVSTPFVQGKQMRWGMAWTYCADIAKRYDMLYSKGDNDSIIEHKHKKPGNEILFHFLAPVEDSNYDRCVVQKCKSVMQKYGITFDGDYDDNQQFIKVDNMKRNGFAFSMKWTVTPDWKDSTESSRVKLSVAMKFKFDNGDMQLFEGFVDWFRGLSAKDTFI